MKNLQSFRQHVSQACHAIGGASWGEVLRDHDLENFLLDESLDEIGPREFFVEAIDQLYIAGRSFNNCAICIAALDFLLVRIDDPDDDVSRDRWAKEIIEITKGPNLKRQLDGWVKSNFP
jgi:hypothetical protein